MTPLYITSEMRSKNLLTAAKAYAKSGIPVLALWGVDDNGSCGCGKAECGSVGKHPIAQMFPHGLKDATTNLSDIRRVWKAYPNANIGLLIDDDLFVIDLDAKGNTCTGRQLASYNLPETPTVITARVSTSIINGRGRGGHLLLKWSITAIVARAMS